VAISFTLNGELREESSVSPTMTALEYLRENAGLTGTKEGCAEGDCGTCTIAMVRNGTDRLEAVNSCLLVVGQLDGAKVVTVEGLAKRNGELESVQQAIVAQDGTQCRRGNPRRARRQSVPLYRLPLDRRSRARCVRELRKCRTGWSG
jgi:xanthine dehydrogenase small subunit